MKTLLQNFVGQTIGINYKKINEFHAVELFQVDDDYFTILVSSGIRQVMIYYPYKQIMFISKCTEGFNTADFWSKKNVKMIIQVCCLTTGGGGGGGGGIAIGIGAAGIDF